MDDIRLRHIVSIGVLYSLGTTLLYIGSRGLHAWQGIIVSFILCIPIYFLYLKLLKKYHGKNIFEIIDCSFGKVISRILIFIYVIFLWYKSGRIVYAYTDLVITTNKTAFNYKELMLLLNLIVLGYVLKSGINNVARFSQIVFVIVTLLTISLFIVGFKNMEFLNIYPIIPINTNDFLYNIFIYLIQPFAELTILFNIIAKVKNYSVQKKALFITALVSLFFILLIIIQTICILGEDYTLILNYPYYACISTINVNKLIARLETMSIITFFICSSVKLIVLIYSMQLGIAKFFNKQTNEKNNYYGLLYMATVLSFLLYNNVGELKNMTIYYCITGLLIIIIYPLIILIFGKKKKQSSLEKEKNMI